MLQERRISFLVSRQTRNAPTVTTTSWQMGWESIVLSLTRSLATASGNEARVVSSRQAGRGRAPRLSLAWPCWLDGRAPTSGSCPDLCLYMAANMRKQTGEHPAASTSLSNGAVAFCYHLPHPRIATTCLSHPSRRQRLGCYAAGAIESPASTANPMVVFCWSAVSGHNVGQLGSVMMSCHAAVGATIHTCAPRQRTVGVLADGMIRDCRPSAASSTGRLVEPHNG